MRIWIDLSNSPHALLFRPISSQLEKRGHTILITVRDNAQTVELARERWPQLNVIGGSSPKGRKAKARAMTRRMIELCSWARSTKPDVALSHNSYGQLSAAWLLGIPAVTAMDFEHQPANHLAFRLARTVLLPAALEPLGLQRQGATAKKTQYYPGLKEELYLSDFQPDMTLLERLPIEPRCTLVVARPAPHRALYHAFENPIFLPCVRSVLQDPSVNMIILPRNREQLHALAELKLPRCYVADRALDSRSLMTQADMMIGAGGTMTREAALLGVPTVSLFAGRRPAVDRWLEEVGLLRIVQRFADFPPLEPGSRLDRLPDLRDRRDMLVRYFCDAVEQQLARGPR